METKYVRFMLANVFLYLSITQVSYRHGPDLSRFYCKRLFLVLLLNRQVYSS